MKTTIYVISDLHLGGEPEKDGHPGFQMCPPNTHSLLENFIDALPEVTSGSNSDVRLVIAGDIVDFLAEKPFQAFTSNQEIALKKLNKILDDTKPVWDALRRFVTKRNGAITFMLGNHDIELSLPNLRQCLLDRIGSGRVDFIYDNQAFTFGPVLVEHGNRFDEWNAVSHGALRRVRSQLSRASPVYPEFPELPGSRLVVNVMNRLKERYTFVDLLKPEDAGALPIVAALGAGGIREVWQFFTRYTQTWAVDFDENREPVASDYIAAPEFTRSNNLDDKQMYELSQEIANDNIDASQIGAAENFLAGIAKGVTDKVREARRDALFKVFQRSVDKHRDAFNVSKETDKYITPARSAVASGFQVVIYGHTHLVKRVGLGVGKTTMPVYLNTGTWADLMRVPDSIWELEDDRAKEALTAFVADLENNSLSSWRRSVPTYAKVEVIKNNGKYSIQDADVYFAHDNSRVTTESIMERLANGNPGA